MTTVYVKTTLGTFVLDLPKVAENPVNGVVAIIDFDGGERQLQVYACYIGNNVCTITTYIEDDVRPMEDDEDWVKEYVPVYNADEVERPL